MSKIIEVKVPDIGSFKDVEIIEVLVDAGFQIDVEDSLITIESDKSSMEIPSPLAGTIKQMLVKVGDRVSEGSVLLMLELVEAGDAAVVTTVETQNLASLQQPAPAPTPTSADLETELVVLGLSLIHI